jgi:hypothetical protein
MNNRWRNPFDQRLEPFDGAAPARPNNDYGDRDKKGISCPIVAFIAAKPHGRRAILPARHSEGVYMVLQKKIPQDTNFAQSGRPVAPAARSTLLIDQTEPFLSRTWAQSAAVIDLLGAGDRSPAGFEGSSKATHLNRKNGQMAVSRLPSTGRIDRLEESIYWFLSAATLIYLLFEIISS